MTDICKLSIQFLKNEYPELKAHDKCPVCSVKGNNFVLGGHRDETGKLVQYVVKSHFLTCCLCRLWNISAPVVIYVL